MVRGSGDKRTTDAAWIVAFTTWIVVLALFLLLLLASSTRRSAYRSAHCSTRIETCAAPTIMPAVAPPHSRLSAQTPPARAPGHVSLIQGTCLLTLTRR